MYGHQMSTSDMDERRVQTCLLALRTVEQLDAGLQARKVAIPALHVRHRQTPIVRLANLQQEATIHSRGHLDPDMVLLSVCRHCAGTDALSHRGR